MSLSASFGDIDAMHFFALGPSDDLYIVSKLNKIFKPSLNGILLTIFLKSSEYRASTMSTFAELGSPCKSRTQLAVSVNGDLYAIRYTNTTSGKVEVTIFSQSSQYGQSRGPMASFWHAWEAPIDRIDPIDFALDQNGNLYSFPKVVGTETDVHIISGPDYLNDRLDLRTNLENDFDKRFSFIIGREFVETIEVGQGLNHDIFVVKKHHTASKKVELYVLARQRWDYRAFTLVAVVNMPEDTRSEFNSITC